MLARRVVHGILGLGFKVFTMWLLGCPVKMSEMYEGHVEESC